MKRRFAKIISLLVALAIIAVVGHTLLGLHPMLLFSHRTEVEGYKLYAEERVPLGIDAIIAKAESIISDSHIYDSDFKIRVIFARDHFYNSLVSQKNMLAYATHYNVILAGFVDGEANELSWGELGDVRMNLTTTLAHEMVHCLQGQHYGFISYAITNKLPFWKQEGYAEYISQRDIRHGPEYTLKDSIDALLEHQDSAGPVRGWITMEDGFDRPLAYFRYRLMVEYLLDIENIGYEYFMNDDMKEDQVYKKMIDWHTIVAEQNASANEAPAPQS